jgi:hypothetical protein
MDRRGFFRALGGAAAGVAAAIALPELELWTPSRTYFLPPAVGWGGNRLWTMNMITQEALAILHKELAFASAINRFYSDAFIEGSQWSPDQRGTMINIRRPPRYAGITS